METFPFPLTPEHVLIWHVTTDIFTHVNLAIVLHLTYFKYVYNDDNDTVEDAL